MREYSDSKIYSLLDDIDNSEVDVSLWEAEFLSKVLDHLDAGYSLTENQRAKAIEIIEEYEDFL